MQNASIGLRTQNAKIHAKEMFSKLHHVTNVLDDDIIKNKNYLQEA